MTTLSIRPATAADLPDLHALIERSYRGEASRKGWANEADLLTQPRTDRATLAAIISDPAQTILVGEDAGIIRACVQVTIKGGGLAYIGLLAVDPDLQAGGFGRTMLTAAENAATERGATRFEMTVVSVRDTLIAYYERRGYSVTSEVRPFPEDLLEGGILLEFAVLAKTL
ncbi:GNAT family N-acetyltransferase [Polymorphobacter sp. PAMC 29334]|uniref:GNAT family N-acetyltransferase n=1 Tax=Polymorphobacter sp. PAMC 29334 TaxID=2862331 RepID=UPI001C77053E|nr:GNAT family N-acetyltransferase [Polymorphobacter sp. PAMC 29334]QYE35833.1 GNAT family N-acetyltransferase [Polymorphobacter sp. PAMC 29334]